MEHSQDNAPQSPSQPPSSHHKTLDVRLVVVLDRQRCGPMPWEEALLEAARGGATAILLRAPELSAHEILQSATRLRAQLPNTTALWIHDRADIALACRADGIHLPEHGMPTAAVRRCVGEKMTLGRSVHSIEAAVRAAQEGADYLLVGTMFPTHSKPGKIPEGPQLLQQIAQRVSIPLVAIGGIGPEHLETLRSCGAHGVAMVSFLLEHPQPKARAARIRQLLDLSSKEETSTSAL